MICIYIVAENVGMYLVELQFLYQPSETDTKAFLLEAAAEHFQNFNHHNQNLDGLT